MIFPRVPVARVFKDYHAYKQTLRRTFLNRCAYCLRHEVDFGGEANGNIDHFCPQAVCEASGQPELVYTYSNLFWSCAECNNIKKESWPDADEQSMGMRFVNATQEDTDDHWEVLPNGEIEAGTPAGEYTIDTIMLWRADLIRWRRAMFETRLRIERIKMKIANPALTPEDKEEYHNALKRDILSVYPHPFDRPSQSQKKPPVEQ
jgi:hypothetical protein